MKYLVTGAAGFIGSRTAALLAQQGHQVVAIDNMNTYYDIRLKNYRVSTLASIDNVQFIQMDIENMDALQELFSIHEFDAVLNLAARAGVRYSMENPNIYLSTNTQGTLNLLELMKKSNTKKMVLASTSSLYAGLPMPFNEDLHVNTPLSPYAASKKAAEMFCYSYHKLYSLNISVVRFFTVYGPAGRPDMSIFRFIKWIAEGTPLVLYGDGSQSRDFTYVDDIARGTILAAQKADGFEVYNLGGGNNPLSLNYMIEKIETYLDKKANVVYHPAHIADIDSTWANIDKAQKMLGWQPETDFDTGLLKAVNWYKENEHWLKDVSCDEGG